MTITLAELDARIWSLQERLAQNVAIAQDAPDGTALRSKIDYDKKLIAIYTLARERLALVEKEKAAPAPGQLQQIYARAKYFREELDRRKDEETAPYKNEDLASMRSLVPDIETLIRTNDAHEKLVLAAKVRVDWGHSESCASIDGTTPPDCDCGYSPMSAALLELEGK